MTQMELQPRARRQDRSESHEAARSVSNVQGLRKRILRAYSVFGPLSDEALSDRLTRYSEEPFSPSGLRTRRNELERMGLVEDTGAKAVLQTGRKACVFRITPAGYEAVE